MIRCGNPVHSPSVAREHHHEDVDMVRRCFQLEGGMYSLEEENLSDQSKPVAELPEFDREQWEADMEKTYEMEG